MVKDVNFFTYITKNLYFIEKYDNNSVVLMKKSNYNH